MKRILLLTMALIYSLSSYAQNGLHFNGTDYVTANYSGITGTAARTVEAWIKTTANCDPNNGGLQNVISDWGTFTTGGRFTFNVLWANAIRVEVGGNGVSGTIPVNDGNWHHVAAVYDPSSGTPVKLYVDGALDVSGNFTVTMNTGAGNNVIIGRRTDNVNNFNGAIDEYRIWNVAKTQAEIQASMNNELCATSNNLMLYYNFNEGSANGNNTGVSTATDLSGNGRHGTLNTFTLNGTTSNWVVGAPLLPGMSASTANITACDQYIWPVTGQTLNQTGTYTASTTNVFGCDSSITLNLTIDAPNDIVQTATACDSFTWSVNGQTYSTSIYIDSILTNGNGCDYHHILDLTINNTYNTTDVIVSCEDSYTWVNGIIYTAPTNTPIYIYTSSNGCDSIVTLDLTFMTISTNVINNDPTLTADQFGLDYQWVDCNDNYSPIAGATSQSFTPTQNGSYAVILSTGSCSDTSACYTVATVGLEELQLEGKILVKVTDLLGRETTPQPNTPLLYIYSDGTIERTFTLD